MSHIGGQVVTGALELPLDLDEGNVVELQRIALIVKIREQHDRQMYVPFA